MRSSSRSSVASGGMLKSRSSSVGTLAAFATYAVGFLARPVGGLVFGHFGDRIGRKNTLVVSMLLMGGATTPAP